VNCENCKTPIDGTATYKGMALCSGCRAKFELRHKYEVYLLKMADLLEERDYEGAIAVLDTAGVDLRPFETDTWLERTLLADRAMVVENQGKLQEALELLNARLALPFDEPSEQAESFLAAALLLHQFDRVSEARVYMSAAIVCLQQAYPRAALRCVLGWLDTGDVEVFRGRHEFVVSAVRAYGLEPPLELANDTPGILDWVKRNNPLASA